MKKSQQKSGDENWRYEGNAEWAKRGKRPKGNRSIVAKRMTKSFKPAHNYCFCGGVLPHRTTTKSTPMNINRKHLASPPPPKMRFYADSLRNNRMKSEFDNNYKGKSITTLNTWKTANQPYEQMGARTIKSDGCHRSRRTLYVYLVYSCTLRNVKAISSLIALCLCFVCNRFRSLLSIFLILTAMCYFVVSIGRAVCFPYSYLMNETTKFHCG